MCVGGANKIKKINPIHLGDYIESNEFAHHDHVTNQDWLKKVMDQKFIIFTMIEKIHDKKMSKNIM